MAEESNSFLEQLTAYMFSQGDVAPKPTPLSLTTC